MPGGFNIGGFRISRTLFPYPGAALSYITQSRVLDLTSSFTSDSTTITDKSGEGNNATLYSGCYASTDGVDDKAIQADATAAGSANYYLTGKVRPTGTSCRVQINDTASGEDDITGLTSGVWQDFTSATFSAQTPSNIVLGWSSNSGFLAVACDWSDVRLVNATTGATVARCQLNESNDSNLDGYPAIDSSGNGYYGTHTGCAGGTGEGIDADVVGAAFAANEDKMYFDGVDDKVETTTLGTFYADNDIIEFEFYLKNSSTGSAFFFSVGTDTNNAFHFAQFSQADGLFEFDVSGVNYGASAIDTSVVGTWTAYTRKSTATATLTDPNGTVYTAVASGRYFGKFANGELHIGYRFRNALADVSFFKGVISNFTIRDGSLTDYLNYSGTELVTWTDTIGSNNGTVNGSPVTVGQKRETILQTAGMDWNRSGINLTGDSELLSGIWNSVSFSSSITTEVSPPPSVGVRHVNKFVCAAGSASHYTNYLLSFDGVSDYIFSAYVRKGDLRYAMIGGSSGAWGSLFTFDLDTGLVGQEVIGTGGTAQILSIGDGWYRISVTATSSVAAGGRLRLGFTNSVSNATFTAAGTEFGYATGLQFEKASSVGLYAPTTTQGLTAPLLLPESDNTAGEDALGNSIANPRPTADTFNGFSTSEYLQIPDDASLESVRSITVAIYNDGTTRDFVQAAGGASFVHSAANVLTTDQTGTHAYYVNGVATTTLAAGWNIVGIVFDAGKDLSGGKMFFESAKLLAYDPTALTADQQLQNFNAFKSQFGL